MLKDTKVVVIIGVVVAALGVFMLSRDAAVGGALLIVLAVLFVGGVLVWNRREEGQFLEAPDDEPRSAEGRATPPSATATATAEPLATWDAEPLATWEPSADDVVDDIEVVEVDEIEVVEAPVQAADDTFDDGGLDELVALEEDDEAAAVSSEADDLEVLEPYEAEFESVAMDEVSAEVDQLSPIDEDVESADDIMKASAATELKGPAAGENSELAKLLAKVQSRLAAYE